MGWFVLSPCGTSVLMNGGTPEIRGLLQTHTNVVDPQSIVPAYRGQLEDWIAVVRARLHAADSETAARLSAELNGILTLYREAGRAPSESDMHQILATDTWIGHAAAEIVAQWLQRWGVKVRVQRGSDMRTDDHDGFQSALSDLVRWSAETFPPLQANGERIIFNLTGGFKSVQGFLQTIGMYYADEMVYIFESRDAALMRIPRLPFEMAVESEIEQHFDVYRRLALGAPVADAEARSLAATLVLRVGADVALSGWGELHWAMIWPKRYRRQLLSSPSELVCFTTQFEAEVAELTSARPTLTGKINQQIDLLVRSLLSAQRSPVVVPVPAGAPAPPAATHTHQAIG